MIRFGPQRRGVASDGPWTAPQPLLRAEFVLSGSTRSTGNVYSRAFR